jgi:hypothetical protein
MANEDKPKPDISEGVKALTTPTTKADNDSNLSEYGQSPAPGTVVVPCKTHNCSGAVESGFVYNVEEWIEGFISKERECPVCKSKAVYSRDDVVVVP